MKKHDDTTPQQSVGESRLLRMADPASGAREASKRIDVIHNPDLDLLGGPR